MADEKKTAKQIQEEAEAKKEMEAVRKSNKGIMDEIKDQNKALRESTKTQNQLVKVMESDSQREGKLLKEVLDSKIGFGKNAGNDRFSDEQKKNLQSQFGLGQLGVSSADAANRVAANNQLEQLNKEKERLEGIQKEFGLSKFDTTELDALESDIKSLEEIQKFGRTLSNFEKGFQMFAGGTMDELIQSTKGQGALTAQGIVKGLGNDLKGDFDKILSFLGPAAGILQQIPFLGTIANLAQTGFKKLFVQMFLTRKASAQNSRKEILSQEKTSKILHQDMSLEAQQRRREARDKMKEKLSKGKGGKDGSGDTTNVQEGDTDLSGGLLGASFALRNLANAKVGAGIAALGTGLASLAALPVVIGAAKLSAAIVLLGGAVALSIAAVISSIALGFKPWDRFNTAETLKDLSSDEIKPGKITALIAGMGAASVLTAIGGLAQTITTLGGTFTPMTDLAKDLGGFAKNVKPFIALDMLGVASNYRVLNEQVMDKTGGLFENFTMWTGNDNFKNFGTDLGEFATAISPFIQMNMTAFTNNIELLQNAIDNLEFDGLDRKQKNALTSLKALGQIRLSQNNLGEQVVLLGKGVEILSTSLDTLSTTKVDMLGKLGKELSNSFSELNINLNANPTVAGVNSNLLSSNMGNGNLPVVAMSPVVNTQTNNMPVSRNYGSSGVSMNSNFNDGLLA